MSKYLAIFLLFVSACFAQNTNVTFTITDSDAQTWNNGQFVVTFLPAPGNPGPYSFNGHVMTAAEKGPYTGTMNGSGTGAITLPSNTSIVPSGTKWQFVLAPNASAASSIVNSAVTGASQDLSATFSTQVRVPRFPALGGSSWGYLDGEVSPIPNPGGSYFNVTLKAVRVWDGSVWFSLSNVASTVTNVTATDPLQSSGGVTPDISFKNQAANTVLAGPATGPNAAPNFRALVPADVPPSILFPLLAPDGSIGAPSYSWANETGSGWYRSSANVFDFAQGGVNIFSFLGTSFSMGNNGVICWANTTNAEDCNRYIVFNPTDHTFEMFDQSAADIYTNLRLHSINLINTATNPGINWVSTPVYMLQATEVTTPASPAATFQRSYFKAGKGECTVDSAGNERCTQKTGTSPIVVTLDSITCPTCLATGTSTIQQVRSTSACTTGSSGHDSCNDTLTWPTSFGDTNYSFACSCADSSIGSAGETAVFNVFSRTATQITVVTQTEHDTRTAHCQIISCLGMHD